MVEDSRANDQAKDIQNDKKEQSPEEQSAQQKSTTHEQTQSDMSQKEVGNPSEQKTPSRQVSVKNIERVLDVNLELTVKIGELKMNLKEILELHPGSIIEIDKNADAPLNLQIGSKVLANGEVVTVGENLGLRVIKK